MLDEEARKGDRPEGVGKRNEILATIQARIKDRSRTDGSSHRPSKLHPMKTVSINMLLILACSCLSCARSHETDRKPGIGDSASARASVSTVVASDTAALVHFLATERAMFDTTLASDGKFSVLVIINQNHQSVLTTIYRDSTVRQIGPNMNIVGLRYPRVRLLSLSQDTVLRIITLDDAVEDIVGTAVDRVEPTGVHREFADATDGCRAADFRMYKATYILRTYIDSPFSQDCLSQCAESIRGVTGVEPAEVVTLIRSDDGWRRIEAQEAQSDTVTSHGYVAMINAIRSGKVPDCTADSLRILQSVMRWQRPLTHSRP
jgi:hypothetical protein